MRARATAFVSLICVLAVSAIAKPGADDPLSKPWRPLFDGKSVDGWKHVGPGRMVLEDGQFHTEGGMGLLWYTNEKLGNCVIRVVYKTTRPQDNSGVFVRVAEPPSDEWYAVHHGFEVQICDATDPFHRTGAVYSMAKATEQPGKVNEWNTLEIRLEGNLIVAKVNGVEVTRFDSANDAVPDRKKWYEPERGPRPELGYIGLQNHDEASRVYFKEVSVRPL